MAVYNAFSKLVSPDVPQYLMSTVKEADAKAAYAAFMDFKDVVKAHPITPATVSSSVSGAAIGDAAKKLSAAAYPFLKEVDWSSDLALKNPGSAGPQQVLKAIDKALVMGAAMDGGALKEAAQAHVKAIASVPTSTVMDVYNAFSGIVSPDVPKYLMSAVKADDAKAAYGALMEFKDVVKAAR